MTFEPSLKPIHGVHAMADGGLEIGLGSLQVSVAEPGLNGSQVHSSHDPVRRRRVTTSVQAPVLDSQVFRSVPHKPLPNLRQGVTCECVAIFLATKKIRRVRLSSVPLHNPADRRGNGHRPGLAPLSMKDREQVSVEVGVPQTRHFLTSEAHEQSDAGEQMLLRITLCVVNQTNDFLFRKEPLARLGFGGSQLSHRDGDRYFAEANKGQDDRQVSASSALGSGHREDPLSVAPQQIVVDLGVVLFFQPGQEAAPDVLLVVAQGGLRQRLPLAELLELFFRDRGF